MSSESATMEPGKRRAHRAQSAWHLVFIGSVLIAVTIVTAGLEVWEQYRGRIDREVAETRSLAIVLAEQTARAFQAVDLVLQETQTMVRAANVADPEHFARQVETEDVHRFLLDRLHSLPQADAVSLIDSTGRIVAFSRAWPTPTIDTSDRDFYAYWRDHADSHAFIGQPVLNKVTGSWVITITRGIRGPNGEFLGIVLGVVEARYFEDLYQVIATSEGKTVTLYRQDGVLLSRHPHREDAIGNKIPAKSPWYETAVNGGTYRTDGYLEAVPLIVSVQPVREYPLAVNVAISQEAALAPWRRQAVMIALGTLGAVIGFAVLFRALALQFRGLAQKSAELTDKTVELEEYSKELKRSNAELEQFAYIASHDLQAPLRLVSSYCSLLQRRYGDRLDQDAKEFIGFAVDGASRMQQLIKDLLAFSRVGRGGVAFQPLDMNDVVGAALANLSGVIADNAATIERAALPRISGERVQLAQVFQNLIGNAIKFRREETPVIRITAQEIDGGFAQFTIADNGIGIKAEYLDRVFVIFQRLHQQEDYPGTGIGLAIVKKVIEYHGGRIWIESIPEEGSRFHFTLPLAKPPAGDAPREAQAAPHPAYA
jgi:signal transduction histidine kinase